MGLQTVTGVTEQVLYKAINAIKVLMPFNPGKKQTRVFLIKPMPVTH